MSSPAGRARLLTPRGPSSVPGTNSPKRDGPAAPDPGNRRHLNILQVLRRLVAQGDISELFADTVMDLYGLRNRVAHAHETPTPESALIFARTADALKRAAIATAKVRGIDQAPAQPS